MVVFFGGVSLGVADPVWEVDGVGRKPSFP